MSKTFETTDEVSYFEMIQSAQDAYESLQKSITISELLTNLERFQSAVEQFGLSPSLLAFTNQDDVLTRVIPTIPSLESYLADPSIFDNTAANEAMMDEIKHVARTFWENVKEHLTKYRTWFDIARGMLLGRFTAQSLLIRTAVGTAFSGSFTNTVSEIVSSFFTKSAVLSVYLPVAALTAALHFAKSTPLAIKESLQLKLPSTPEQKTRYIKKIRDIFHDRARINIDTVGHDVPVPHGSASEHEEKYTTAQIKAFIVDVSTAVTEVTEADYIPNGLSKLSASSEAQTEDGREALLFLIRLINKTMHAAVVDVSKGLQGLSTIHSAIEHQHKEAAAHV